MKSIIDEPITDEIFWHEYRESFEDLCGIFAGRGKSRRESELLAYMNIAYGCATEMLDKAKLTDKRYYHLLNVFRYCKSKL